MLCLFVLFCFSFPRNYANVVWRLKRGSWRPIRYCSVDLSVHTSFASRSGISSSSNLENPCSLMFTQSCVCSVLSAASVWSRVSTVSWSWSSAKPWSMRSTVGRVLNPAPCANATSCWERKPSIRPCVGASHLPRRGGWPPNLLEHGLRHSPSTTCWGGKKGEIITVVLD